MRSYSIYKAQNSENVRIQKGIRAISFGIYLKIKLI